MGKVIPQHEREKQIRDLCEGTVYSFAGWENGYKNLRSKLFLKCELHGVKPVRLEEFLNKSQRRCKTCSSSKPRGSYVDEQTWVERILTKNSEYVFVKFTNEKVGYDSEVTLNCRKHGTWNVSLVSATKGCECPDCFRERLSNQLRKPKSVITAQISRKLNEKGYSFVAFVDDYVNQNSRIIANCNQHGDWELSTQKAIAGRGCPKCKVNRLREVFSYTPIVAEQIIGEAFRETIWHFEGWKDGYHNQKSKLICRCDKHGEWVSSFSSIYNQRTGCPACGKYGFSRNLTGYLYALRSSCGNFIKIGITNYPGKRIKGLRNKTPFCFDVVEKIKFENGSTCKELEKMFHDNFESAGFKGFDGATEWLKWTPEVQHWLRLLN